MLLVLRTELSKQLRRPRTYVALGAMALVPIIMTVAIWAKPPRFPRGANDGFFYFASRTGLFVPVASLVVMSRLLLVFTVAVFAGDAVAGEASWGTLRYLLVRPVGRGRLLAAKLANAAFFALVATVVITVSGLIAGAIAFGWTPLPPIAAVFGFDQSNGRIVADLALATLYVSWSLAALVTFGFMVSTMTDTPSGAIGAAVGLYVVSQIIDAIEPLGSLRYALPTHYLDAWTNLFTHHHSTAEMVRGALLQVPYLVVFCGVAWWWFHRKDIVS